MKSNGRNNLRYITDVFSPRHSPSKLSSAHLAERKLYNNGNSYDFYPWCAHNMNFTNNYDIKIFDDFYSVYGQQIDKLWPELKDVVIDVYDKDSAQLKDYIINQDVLGDMSENIDSPFQFYLNFQYHNQTFNDIIMRGDLCNTAHLTQQEQFALIAHEIGHFVSTYKNTGLNGQADEFYADDRTVELGLRCELASALRKCMVVIPQPNSLDPFLQMIQKQHDSVKNMADMLQERIDRL